VPHAGYENALCRLQKCLIVVTKMPEKVTKMQVAKMP
jgi:hypothetical protein